jgi:hypothetical protein
LWIWLGRYGLENNTLIKDGTIKGWKNEAVKEALSKVTLKSYIILGKDFV